MLNAHARFHAPGARLGEPIALPEEEAEHLGRVLRLKAGATIAVFDGRGCEFEAVVESVGKSGVTVRPTGRAQPAPEPSVRLTLGIGVTRGDRMDAAVRDAAMLGVSVVQPVISARADTTARAIAQARRLERWRRIAVSSVKQCGRAVVPEVREPLAYEEYIAGEVADARILLVEPRAAQHGSLAGLSKPDGAAVVIGPEGGWTEGEIEAARRALFHTITLGQRTLRADAMPIAAIAVLQFLWGDL
jgi:16S rRNA (uracil1498-N3)-methyltransferase